MMNKLLSFPTFFFIIILCLSRPSLVPARIIHDWKLTQLNFQEGEDYEPSEDIPIGQLAPSPAYNGDDVDDPITTVQTYAFSPDHMITYITKTEIQNAFEKAFGRWSAVIPVTFREVDDYKSADISIGWYDGEPFDGVSGILASTSLSEDWRLTIHFDAAETWAVADQYKGSRALWRLWPTRACRRAAMTFDLESVAVHEIGHVLGLGHSKVKESIMYPNNKPWRKKVELAADDVECVQAIYGSNPNSGVDSARSGGGVILWWPSSIWTRIGVLVGLILGSVVLLLVMLHYVVVRVKALIY